MKTILLSLLATALTVATSHAEDRWGWSYSEEEFANGFNAATGEDISTPYNPASLGGGSGYALLGNPTLALGASINSSSFPIRPERSPFTMTTTFTEDFRIITRYEFSSSLVADEETPFHRRYAPNYRGQVVVSFFPEVPAALAGREGVIGVLTGIQTGVTYSINVPDKDAVGPEASVATETVRISYSSNEAFNEEGDTNESSGFRSGTQVGSVSNPLATVEMIGGNIIYKKGGIRIPGLELFSSSIGMPHVNSVNGVTFPRSVTVVSETQFAFQWLEFDNEFIWEGTSSTGFNNPLNWESNQVPGASDTVEFSSLGLKTIELPPSELVESARLIAKAGSETGVNLNSGIWRLGSAAGISGALRVDGGKLTLANGTMESSAGIAVLTNAPGNSLVTLQEGGKLRLPGGVFSIGAGGGAGEATLQVIGENSLAEAFTVTVGGQGKGNLLATNRGTVFAQQNFFVGAEGVGEANFTEGAELRTGDNGALHVGLRAAGALVFENGGKALLGEDTSTSIGSATANGSMDVRGPDSSFFASFGSQVTVLENGLMTVREGASLFAPDLDIEGGAVFVSEGGTADLDGRLSVLPGGNLEVGGGDSRLSTEGFFLAGGQVSVQGGGWLQIQQRNGETARVLGGVLDIGDDGQLNVNLLQLEGGTLMGTGTIFGAVQQSGGFLRPGASPGILTIEGNFAQAGGLIVLEIGGTGAGTQSDQLVVTGDCDFAGGEVEFSFIGGFAPVAGQTFELLAVGGSFTGSPSIIVSGLLPGWEFDADFDAGTNRFKVTSLNQGIAIPANDLLFQASTIIPATPDSPARFSGSVQGPAGATVAVEFSTDLGEMDAWQEIGRITLDAGGNGVITDMADPGSIGSTRDFLRIRPVP